MKSSFDAIAIFCEDIREEKSGQDLLVGTLPDNLHLATSPTTINMRPLISRLGVYVRINCQIDDKPRELSVKLLNSDGSLLAQNWWEQSVIDKAFADSKENQIPLVGLIAKFLIGPLPITGSGKISVIAAIDGSECIIGILNVTVLSAGASPSPA